MINLSSFREEKILKNFKNSTQPIQSNTISKMLKSTWQILRKKKLQILDSILDKRLLKILEETLLITLDKISISKKKNRRYPRF